jgi:hypothetical protein
MRLPDRLRALTPTRCAQVFVVLNLAFLALDVWIAHLTNAFAQRVEWAPIVISAVAAVLLLPGLVSEKLREKTRHLDLVIGGSVVLVGIAGMVLHLQSAFFDRETIHDLVYAAPFVAPLSFVGVGLLVLLLRLEKHDSFELGAWIVFLAMGGFFGNTALSLLDHAQNGFFSVAEWIPVGASAFATTFLLVAVVRPERAFLRLCLGVLAAQVVVGVVGFALHALANQRRPGEDFLARTVHGAPIFAPLLFANLALLAAIGIWAMLRAGIPERAKQPVAARASG